MATATSGPCVPLTVRVGGADMQCNGQVRTQSARGRRAVELALPVNHAALHRGWLRSQR